MRNKGMSDKEAALLAAARRELAKPSAALPGATAQVVIPTVPQVPRTSKDSVAPLPLADTPEFRTPSDPRPALDISTRMAMLIDAERQASEQRKRRIKRNYMILVSAVMVPAFLYALVTLFRLLAR